MKYRARHKNIEWEISRKDVDLFNSIFPNHGMEGDVLSVAMNTYFLKEAGFDIKVAIDKSEKILLDFCKRNNFKYYEM